MHALPYTEELKERFYCCLIKPKIAEIKAAWELLCEVSGKQNYEKVTLKFANPVRVQVNGRKVKEFTEATVRLFESQSGVLCYTFHRATGYPVYYLDTDQIIELGISSKEKDHREAIAKVRSLRKKIHPNAWSDLRGNLDETPEDYIGHGLSTINMKTVFGEGVVKLIKNAFNDKTNFHFRKSGVKRDRSVEVKMCEDGVLRAWYSSEFAGCANGYYYLLINPTIATFCERD